eukprot:Skav209189  [mRNA]  locus=scaffold1137:694305:700400:+ [translate_table: standard]
MDSPGGKAPGICAAGLRVSEKNFVVDHGQLLEGEPWFKDLTPYEWCKTVGVITDEKGSAVDAINTVVSCKLPQQFTLPLVETKTKGTLALGLHQRQCEVLKFIQETDGHSSYQGQQWPHGSRSFVDCSSTQRKTTARAFSGVMRPAGASLLRQEREPLFSGDAPPTTILTVSIKVEDLIGPAEDRECWTILTLGLEGVFALPETLTSLGVTSPDDFQANGSFPMLGAA